MTTFTVAYCRHATSEQVTEQVQEWLQSGESIDNAAALAIASWWQAPGGYGYTFAVLASSGTVIANDLRDSIRHERNLPTTDAESRTELDALAAWVDTCEAMASEVDA